MKKADNVAMKTINLAVNKRRGDDLQPSLSIVMPCYNEEGAIASTIQELRHNIASITSYEIIVVDDGSTDRSYEILLGLEDDDPNIRVIHNDNNCGYGAALKAGIRRANAEIIAITDADGTYPSESITDLLEAARDVDMVVGARTGQNVVYSKIRMIPKMFFRRYSSWLVGRDIPDINSGMRIFRRSVVERFLDILPNTFSFTTTITLAMMMNHYSVRYIPIDYSMRIGKSKIHPIKDTLRFLQLIVRTGVYFAPLRIFMPVAAVLMVAFIASLGYDMFILENLTDKTILLLLFTLNTGMFALLADMIDKRSIR